jgi:hypothetical protein
LNPNARPRRNRREEKTESVPQEEKPVVAEEKPVVAEEKPVVAEEKPAEEKPAEEVPATETDNKRRKKKGGEEVKQEELLQRPENALSYTEYLEQLKQKNATLAQPKKTVAPTNVNNDLQVKAQNEADFEIGLSNAAKKQRKNKEKKREEKGLDYIVQTETNVERKYEPKGKRNGKFNFNDEEFPEL